MKLPKTSVRIESIRTPVRSHVANTVICRVAAARISFVASSPNIFSKKADPSGGSFEVSVISVPPSTATNE